MIKKTNSHGPRSHDLFRCAYGYACRNCGRRWRRANTPTLCAGGRVYYDWSGIPEHLKTKTQLKELRLKPPKDSPPFAWMDHSSRDTRYGLYIVEECTPMKAKRALTEKQQAALEKLHLYNRRGPLCTRCEKHHAGFHYSGGRRHENRLCEACIWDDFYAANQYVVEPWTGETVFLDTETTGLCAGSDRIVEIAVVDEGGRALMDTLVDPERDIPEEATAIHGITLAMIKAANAPTLDQIADQIVDLVRGKRLVIYNADFDVDFLPRGTREAAGIIDCCMERFAAWAGEWNAYYGNWRWHSLGVAAEAADFEWPSDAHRALPDTLACRSVWRFLDQEAAGRTESKTEPKPKQTPEREMKHMDMTELQGRKV